MLTAETEQGVKNAVELYPRNSSVRVNLRGFRKIAERVVLILLIQEISPFLIIARLLNIQMK